MDTNKGEIIIYSSHKSGEEIEVRLYEETVWLSLLQLSQLFERDKSVISRHINNTYKTKELDRISTVANFATVQTEGGRKIIRDIDYYNLDIIISVGYRVNSNRGTQFRIWATKTLKDYLIKGFAVNEKRLKETQEQLIRLKQTVQLIENVSKSKRLKQYADVIM